MCGGAAPDHHGYLARVEMELLITAKLPSVKVEVFVDDITALLIGRKQRM